MKGFCVPVALVVLVACIKCENSLMKRSSWKTLDDSSRKVKVFNKYARVEMIYLIPGELESLRATYKTSLQTCSYEIKKAAEACKGCITKKKSFGDTLCTFLVTNIIKAAEWLEKYITLPFVEIAKLVEDIVGKLKDTLNDLGKGSVKFLNDIGKFAEKLGDDLLKGAGYVVKKVIDGLKKIGEDMIKLGEDVAKKIGNGVEDITKEIGSALDDLGRETGNLMKGIEDVANDIGKGIEDVAKDIGKGVEDIGKNIGEGFEDAAKEIGGWFGKRDLDRMRRTCSINCPICSKIDKKKNSNEQIFANICGSELNALGDRVKKVAKKLKKLYDVLRAPEFSIIKSIRYDRDSEDEEDVYKENYVTYEINGKRHEFKSASVLDTFEKATTGKFIGNQIMRIMSKQDFALV